MTDLTATIEPGRRLAGWPSDNVLLLVDDLERPVARVRLPTGFEPSEAVTRDTMWQTSAERLPRRRWRLAARPAGSETPIAACYPGWMRSYRVAAFSEELRLRSTLASRTWRLFGANRACIARITPHERDAQGAVWAETAADALAEPHLGVLVLVSLQAVLFEAELPRPFTQGSGTPGAGS